MSFIQRPPLQQADPDKVLQGREKAREKKKKLGGAEGAAAGKLASGILGSIADVALKTFFPALAPLPIKEGVEQIGELAGREIGKEVGPSDDTGETAKALNTASTITDIAAKFIPDISPTPDFNELDADAFSGTLLEGAALSRDPGLMPHRAPESIPLGETAAALGKTPSRKTSINPLSFPGLFSGAKKRGGW